MYQNPMYHLPGSHTPHPGYLDCAPDADGLYATGTSDDDVGEAGADHYAYAVPAPYSLPSHYDMAATHYAQYTVPGASDAGQPVYGAGFYALPTAPSGVYSLGAAEGASHYSPSGMYSLGAAEEGSHYSPSGMYSLGAAEGPSHYTLANSAGPYGAAGGFYAVATSSSDDTNSGSYYATATPCYAVPSLPEPASVDASGAEGVMHGAKEGPRDGSRPGALQLVRDMHSESERDEFGFTDDTT